MCKKQAILFIAFIFALVFFAGCIAQTDPIGSPDYVLNIGDRTLQYEFESMEEFLQAIESEAVPRVMMPEMRRLLDTRDVMLPVQINKTHEIHSIQYGPREFSFIYEQISDPTVREEQYGKWVHVKYEFDNQTNDIRSFERYVAYYKIIDRISRDGKEIVIATSIWDEAPFSIALIDGRTMYFLIGFDNWWERGPVTEDFLVAIDNFEFYTFDQRATVLEREAERAR